MTTQQVEQLRSMVSPVVRQGVTQQSIIEDFLAHIQGLLPDFTPREASPWYLDKWNMAFYLWLTEERKNALARELYPHTATTLEGFDVSAGSFGFIRDPEDGLDTALRKYIAEILTRRNPGTDSAIRAGVYLADMSIIAAGLVDMSDGGINIYANVLSDGLNNNVDPVVYPNTPSSETLDNLTDYFQSSGMLSYGQFVNALSPIQQEFEIEVTVQYNSAAVLGRGVSINGFKKLVADTINEWIQNNCVVGNLITPSKILSVFTGIDLVYDAEFTGDSLDDLVSALEIASDLYAVAPTDSDSSDAWTRAGESNAVYPYYHTSVANDDKRRLLLVREAIQYVCFPDANTSDAPPANNSISLTFTDIG